MTPLRIVHVTNEPFGSDSANGVQHVVYCLARAQAESGHSVAVFSRDDEAVTVLGDGARSPRPAARRLPAQSQGWLRGRLLSRYFEQPLADDVVAWQPEIVHFHSVHIPQNVALAAHLSGAGIPYCVSIHGALFRAALRRGLIKKAVFKLTLERRYLSDAQFIHAVSPHETADIRRYGVKRPIVTVPNGLPPDHNLRALRPDALYAEHPWLRDRRVFLFLGRLELWQKGLDILVRAFADSGVSGAALVLVGPDCRGSRRKLTSLADRLGILHELAFIGPAFGHERANLFAAADVFVHPSRWEGLSMSVLAAAAAGKPCLITREADPLGELERAEAAIVVQASVSSIADGLRRAATLGDGELEIMGTRARRVAGAHFTWPAIAGQLVEAYRSAIERRALDSAREILGRNESHHG